MRQSIGSGIAWRSERARSWLRLMRYRAALRTRRPVIGTPRPHGLPMPLVVSLTSYPARFANLHRTLECLLVQSVRPDAVVLWIAPDDMAQLPWRVRRLQNRGLTILPARDIRSYKKIIPALERFPDAAIVTADDDLHFAPDWLEQLVAAWRENPYALPCHRAHRIRLSAGGSPRTYREWQLEIDAGPAGPTVFPTSGAGVLYPPGSLHPDTLREELFTTLCPMADDIWLYAMARRNGRSFRKVGDRRPLVTWDLEQDSALSHHNLECGGNDRQFRAVLAHYAACDMRRQRARCAA